jgi:hypothetical protein
MDTVLPVIHPAWKRTYVFLNKRLYDLHGSGRSFERKTKYICATRQLFRWVERWDVRRKPGQW